MLFTVFRTWLRRQFTLLGRKADADALAMSPRPQPRRLDTGSRLSRREVHRAGASRCAPWLESYTGYPAPDADDGRSADEPAKR